MAKELFQVAGLACLLERKNIKNIYIRVLPPSGEVQINAPIRLSTNDIGAFVQSKLAWIEKCKTEICSRPKAPDPLALQFVWGQPYRVRFVHATAAWIRLEGKELLAAMPHGSPPEVWNVMLASWHKSLMECAAPAILEHWRRILGLNKVELAVRVMKRRWGTCYPQRHKILLNSRLAEKPRDCLAYVITHELLHLRHPNHGPDFRKELASHWPHWRQLDDILDNKLIFSE